MRSNRIIRIPALVLAALAFAGCDDPNRPEAAAAVAPLSGNAQPGTVGAALGNPLVVRVTDDDGDPVRKATVTFAVVSGGGTVQPTTATTGSDGLAQATWTLGPTAGEQTVTATVEGLSPVTFTATAAAGAATRLRISPDSSTIGALGQQAVLQAAYLDPFGNAAGTPAAGAVAWSTLDPTVATAEPGGQPGEGRATATGPGRARIVATAGTMADTAVVGVVPVPSAVVVQVAGGGTLVVGRTAQATATVLDPGGAPIPGAAVTWSSSDNAVITVSQTGLITAVAPGTAQVRAMASTGFLTVVNITVLAGFQVSSQTEGFSAGGHTTCATAPDGQMLCWGAHHTGQGGFAAPNEDRALFPRAAATSLRFINVSTGGVRDPQAIDYPRGHTCAVSTSNEAWCWGNGTYGQLGTGTLPEDTCRVTINNSWTCSRVPLEVAGNIPWRRIAAGTTHTCGISVAGVAYCWGANDSGQLGAPGSETCPRTAILEDASPCATAPVQVTGSVPSFALVTAGDGYSCALSTTGAAWCWGRNDQGQLGNGTNTGSAVPVPVSGGHLFSRISAEYAHTCGVTTTGSVYCWGRNASGQLGNAGTAASSTPVPVSGGGNWFDVSAGRNHTCALRAGSTAWCWGSGAEGQLGVPGAALSTTPVQVAGDFTYAAISAGGWHGCARRTGDSVLMCWGYNHFGAVGSGTMTGAPEPVPVRAP